MVNGEWAGLGLGLSVIIAQILLTIMKQKYSRVGFPFFIFKIASVV